MSDIARIKSQLRGTLRQRRRSLSPSAQRSAAQALLGSIEQLPTWANARRIALYQATDGEIGTTPLAQLARNLGKQLYLPIVIAGGSLEFAHWDANDTLAHNRYHIPEPPAAAARCAVADLDIVFLPVVGWDRRGGRLGMGAGYYDRTLSGITGPLLVGLAHDQQQTEELPQESWDVTLSYIATNVALYHKQTG